MRNICVWLLVTGCVLLTSVRSHGLTSDSQKSSSAAIAGGARQHSPGERKVASDPGVSDRLDARRVNSKVHPGVGTGNGSTAHPAQPSGHDVRPVRPASGASARLEASGAGAIAGPLQGTLRDGSAPGRQRAVGARVEPTRPKLTHRDANPALGGPSTAKAGTGGINGSNVNRRP
jgi:hypothetical protein